METMAACLGEALKRRGWLVATAESCTAGGIGAAIASIDGASAYYVGGVTTYATELKVRLLRVSRECIDTHGVVSREMALAMNEGVRGLTGADVAISITGYAGGTGGDRFAPNGTIWICVQANGHDAVTKCLTVNSGRTENLKTAVGEALAMAIDYCAAG